MKLYRKTVDSTVDMAVERSTATLYEKIKSHFSENKKIYLGVAGGVVTGAILSRRNQVNVCVSPTVVVVVDDRKPVERVPELL
jgi:hypothetical protein